MAKVKVEQDRNACIGCGACAAICPANWEMKPDGKASPKNGELDDAGCNQEAADACPVQCIKVITK